MSTEFARLVQQLKPVDTNSTVGGVVCESVRVYCTVAVCEDARPFASHTTAIPFTFTLGSLCDSSNKNRNVAANCPHLPCAPPITMHVPINYPTVQVDVQTIDMSHYNSAQGQEGWVDGDIHAICTYLESTGALLATIERRFRAVLAERGKGTTTNGFSIERILAIWVWKML